MTFNLSVDGTYWVTGVRHSLFDGRRIELSTDLPAYPIFIQIVGREMIVFLLTGEKVYQAPYVISDQLSKIEFTVAISDLLSKIEFTIGRVQNTGGIPKPVIIKKYVLEYWVGSLI